MFVSSGKSKILREHFRSAFARLPRSKRGCLRSLLNSTMSRSPRRHSSLLRAKRLPLAAFIRNFYKIVYDKLVYQKELV